MNAIHKFVSFSMTMGSFLALAVAPAFAEGAVKVECQGNCANVTLGQACDTFSLNSNPVAVACDDTATPGGGTIHSCGNAGGCTPDGFLFRTDQLSLYCADGHGNDAVVTCR